MKKTLIIVLCLVLAMGLTLSGCGKKAPAPQPQQPADTWPSQQEVVAAIDRVIAEMNVANMSADDDYSAVIAALQKVIPKPVGYPERNIEYIIPWGEGGGSDMYSRHIGRDASKIMGVSIIYNNMPGGGGEVGLAHLLTQPADGYTIYGAIANQTINDALGTQPHSFTNVVDFIIRNQGATEVYWVRADSPFATIQDMIDFAIANPGQLTINGAGAGGDDEFRIASLARELGTEIVYVPYNAVGERISSLLGGHVNVMHETVGTVYDLFLDKQIRPLAIGGDMRFTDLDPNIPSIAELGYSVPIGRWRGITTIKGTDPKIIDFLHNSFYAASKLPYYREYEIRFFQHLAKAYLNSADFASYAKAERDRMEQLARELGYIK
jgi:tripartite-type tricarboxylate transporter receptor subunit TctC/predicted small lipoprotein YifL